MRQFISEKGEIITEVLTNYLPENGRGLDLNFDLGLELPNGERIPEYGPTMLMFEILGWDNIKDGLLERGGHLLYTMVENAFKKDLTPLARLSNVIRGKLKDELENKQFVFELLEVNFSPDYNYLFAKTIIHELLQ